ncbi:cell wall-binding repeat-containing protein [Miniphocaeibacter halophilus]|uniref:Cell wall-binding repeat-containing protein n=1 Tax=Miniphocaeibacter halophilus TaxID=2931922 RepID=A0AC61MRS2_9FIRM|nr:cell wall-binding repeat-containing protein [Miniphocaeibacter halophilus]QQK08260.1 cell wall-binding repeat-containing protein [Miniphocaeibacter halophilus]
MLEAIKNKNKIIFLLSIILIMIFTNISFAESKEVGTVEELQTAVAEANNGDIIKLADNFEQGNVVLEMPDVVVTVDCGNIIWTEGNIIIKGDGTGSLTIKDLRVDGTNIEVAYNHKLIMNQSENGKLILENVEIYNSTVGAINVNTGPDAHTELNRVYIHDNTARNTAPAIFVGAGETKSDSHLTINNSTIENNIGTGDNYECGALSGKNYTGNITINNTIFRNNINKCDNTSIYGGGGGAIALHYFYGKVEINESVFDKNQSNGEGKKVRSTYDGGAIYVLDGRNGAEFNINKSTFSNNIAYDDGGAIMFQGTFNPGFITNIKNSTFVNNKAYGLDGAGYSGGAIQYFKNGGSSQMINKIHSTTFVANQSGNENSTTEQRGGAIALHGAGLFPTPSVSRYNSLFIGNRVYNNGVPDETSNYKDISNNQLKVAGGVNVVNVDKGDPGDTPNYTVKDILGVSEAVLQDNLSKITAGFNDEIIQTIPIKPESIADNTYTGTEKVPEKDQRNFNRYKDQGAVEMSWIKYDANGGEFSLPDLKEYDGSIYYEKDKVLDESGNEIEKSITKYYTIGTVSEPITNIIDGQETLKANREGYKFLGWSTKADAVEADSDYEVGKEIYYVEDNFTLYAVWEEKHRVSYDGNGNTGGVVPVDEEKYEKGSKVTLKGNEGNLEKTGYTFAGWSLETDNDESKVITEIESINENTTVYAVWKEVPKYRVSYNGNGNTGGVVPVDEEKYEKGSKVTLKGNEGNLEKTGYTFAGWSLETDNDESKVITEITSIEEDTRVYAVWKLDTSGPGLVYVSFEPKGGVFDDDTMKTKVVEVKKGDVVVEENISKEGYIFKGWYLEDGTKYDFELKVTENLKLLAKWEEDSTDTTNPSEPTNPTNPTNPTEPTKPTVPTEPSEPGNPSKPEKPANTIKEITLIGGRDTLTENIENQLKKFKLNRIYGKDRYETSVKVSETYSKSKLVLLASGEKYTDELTATVLANKLDAPIMLTRKDAIPAEVKAEINRLGASKVILVGGRDSISEKVEKELSSYTIERIGGPDRYDTAILVGKQVRGLTGKKSEAILVDGSNFPDAIAMTSMAVEENMPILLTKPTELPASTAKTIKDWKLSKVTIGGGVNSVSDMVANEVKKFAAVDRIAGADRYETSVLVAEQVYVKPKHTVIASGEVFPDAIVGAPYAAKNGYPIVLSRGNNVPEVVVDYLLGNK